MPLQFQYFLGTRFQRHTSFTKC